MNISSLESNEEILKAMPPSDGQKRFDRFLELVKKAYAGSHKNEEMYKTGQNLWQKVKTDEAEYKTVFNDLTAGSGGKKKKTITFWPQQTKNVLLQQILRTKKILRVNLKFKIHERPTHWL